MKISVQIKILTIYLKNTLPPQFTNQSTVFAQNTDQYLSSAAQNPVLSPKDSNDSVQAPCQSYENPNLSVQTSGKSSKYSNLSLQKTHTPLDIHSAQLPDQSSKDPNLVSKQPTCPNLVSKQPTCPTSNPNEGTNISYSPSFTQYLLDNWCGLIPILTGLHLGDQGRHGTSPVYQLWSHKYESYDCVKDPPRTQSIVSDTEYSFGHRV